MSEALVPSNLEEFAAQNGMTAQEAAAVLSDPEAAKRLQEITKWRARIAFHGRGIERLIRIANGDDDKLALNAIGTLGKLAGEFKAPRPIQLNFDGLMKNATASPGPLSNLTQITESAVIDAEEDAGGDDD